MTSLISDVYIPNFSSIISKLFDKKDITLQSPIFLVIPFPLWKDILLYLQNDRQTLGSLRLTCRLFRNLSSPVWKQIIHKNFPSYLARIQQFQFELIWMDIRVKGFRGFQVVCNDKQNEALSRAARVNSNFHI